MANKINITNTDLTDALAGSNYRTDSKHNPSGLIIRFEHVASGQQAEFKAFLEDYSDNFSSDWNHQDTWGRMDNIQTFRTTVRKITLAWSMPSYSEDEAISNFQEISKLQTMLYPTYEDLSGITTEDGDSDEAKAIFDSANSAFGKAIDTIEDTIASGQSSPTVEDEERANRLAGILASIQDEIMRPTTNSSKLVTQRTALISAPPILKLKFVNFISSADGDGLYGVIDGGFNFKPDLEAGLFMRDGILVPMTCKCSCEFIVIHTDKLGWTQGRNLRTPSYPYQADKIKRGR